MQLVLASQSPYRKAQLQALGLRFISEQPLVDETALKKEGPKDLTELTRFLALRKAESLKAKHPAAILLGGDQIAELDGVRLDKPGTREAALVQLKKLRGRTHRLITSIALVSPLKTLQRTDVTSLTLRHLSDEEIAAYVDLDQPFDCAGSYKIERAGIGLIESIDSKDPSAIQGLPLISLMHGLNELGLSLTNLWSKV